MLDTCVKHVIVTTNGDYLFAKRHMVIALREVHFIWISIIHLRMYSFENCNDFKCPLGIIMASNVHLVLLWLQMSSWNIIRKKPIFTKEIIMALNVLMEYPQREAYIFKGNYYGFKCPHGISLERSINLQRKLLWFQMTSWNILRKIYIITKEIIMVSNDLLEYS